MRKLGFSRGAAVAALAVLLSSTAISAAPMGGATGGGAMPHAGHAMADHPMAGGHHGAGDRHAAGDREMGERAAGDHHVMPVHARGDRMGHRRGFDRGAQLGSRAEGRIAFLKTELKISDAQSASFEPVAKAIRDQAAAMQRLHDELKTEREKAQQDQAATAPEVLARRDRAVEARTKAMALRAEGQKQFAAAFTELYQQLNDEQKKAADALFARRHQRH